MTGVYKKFKAYQPLNCWWSEQGAMLYWEFRDGNVPAGHEQLRVLKDCLPHLPDSVKTVSLRSDTAGYQEELLLYCGEGKDPRFGVIEFAVGADVTEAFRTAVLATAESEWRPLIRRVGDSLTRPIRNGPRWPTRPIGPDTAASAPIIVFWRSASRCANWRWAARRNCRSRQEASAARDSPNCSAS